MRKVFAMLMAAVMTVGFSQVVLAGSCGGHKEGDEKGAYEKGDKGSCEKGGEKGEKKEGC